MKIIFNICLLSALCIYSVSGLGEVCDDDRQCNDLNDERCQKTEYCSNGKGVCVCKEGLVNSNGACRTIAKVGSSCADPLTTTCGYMAYCMNNVCVCQTNNEKTADGKHCKPSTERNNGATCNTTHFCTGPSLNCINGKCECLTGSDWVDNSLVVYGDHKMGMCIHKKSKLDLLEGDRCSQQGPSPSVPTLLCGADLQCGLCPEENANWPNHICMKTSYSSSVAVKYSLGLLLSVISAVLLL